jgi:5-(carboxyamino)imidazole ribonucleotide synthase
MANLLGDVWGDGLPNYSVAFQAPGAYLHLYGKRNARHGRKMGHLTVLDSTPEQAADRAIQIRDQMRSSEAKLF